MKKKPYFWEESFSKLTAAVTITSVFVLINICIYRYGLLSVLSEIKTNKLGFFAVLYFLDFFIFLVGIFYVYNFKKIQKRDPEETNGEKFILGLLPTALCFLFSVALSLI